MFDLCLFLLFVDFLKICIFRYMPVFLWKEKMKRLGLDPFNELLKLVAGRQNDDIDEDEVCL